MVTILPVLKAKICVVSPELFRRFHLLTHETSNEYFTKV